jgi:Ig-like domain CHU_C associated
MQRFAVAVCLLFLAASLSAATFDLPSDRALLDRADVVVVATVVNAAGRAADDGMILTDYQLRVEDVLKGHAAATIVVSESGGFFNGRGVEIAGSAVYNPGSRVVAFLRQRPDGTYYTAYMGLGKYRFKKELLIRDADGIETISGDPAADVRKADAFIAAIRSGKPSRAQRIEADGRPDPEPRTQAAASAYVLTTNGPKRWKNCETGCTINFTINNGAQAVTNPIGGLQNALAAWTNHANSFVNLGYNNVGGDIGRTNDDENDIVFMWDGSNPHSSCEAAKGCGIVYFNGAPDTHIFRDEVFNDVIAADVLIHQSVTNQLSYESILTHELGHALAFRHSNAGTPSGGGIMNSSVPTNLGATIDLWAQEALSAVYGPGVACVPVSITSTSGAGSVTSGQTKTLSVTVTGDSPRTFQWYEGLSGDTSLAVGTNSQSFTTPPITSTKNYWVKVTNGCPPAAPSATITVTAVECNEPNITSEPQNHEIATNATTTLAITATGTSPLTYRWYRANSVGDTSNQVATTASFTTPVLAQTTRYWARVSNNCGQDDTALITVTVTDDPVCVQPAITTQSTNLTVGQGDGATISVTPSGTAPFTYQWYQGDAPSEAQPIAGATAQGYAAGPFNDPGTYKFWAKVSNECGSVNSATVTITVDCPPIDLPLVSTPANSHFSNSYNVSWTGSIVTSTFEVQEATDAAFTQNVQTFPVTGALSRAIAPHVEITTDTRFYYRVRAIPVCTGQPTAWSNVTSTVVTSPLPADSNQFAFSVPAGSTQSFTQDLLVPGFGETAHANDTFSITTDVPWITVFPPSGALSAGGTTVQLTILPSGLSVGSKTGTIQITRTPGAAGKGVATNDGPVSTSLPLGLSLVTPVSPDPRDGNPPPGTLIIPAVAHAQGIGSPFRSDVRIVNVSFSDIDYGISYTPSQLNGLLTGKKTTVTIHSGDVLALDDIVASWYGAGLLGEGGIGTIEIRPLNSGNPLDTFASSRTYALTGGGTLGQFIPALRANQFIGNFAQDTLSRISLQMIAASADYRTNVGFVEGTGSPVSFVARLVDGNNNVLSTFNGALQPFGHLQRGVPDMFGGVQLNDGRVEVEVVSPGGKVSAYASVLNNKTNDPLMVFPVQPARTTAERYVLAGIAEFNAGSNFHSDMRMYNAGSSAVTATLVYHPFGSETPTVPPVQITLNPGEVRAIDDVLPTLWPGLSGGGSVIATTSGPSSLVVTAQTFSLQPDGGTKGQFIPGVTFREATGVGERPLEVLQLEQSDQYRSNVGFVEVTGKPALIEVTAFEPDTKTSRVTQIPLKANEYVQYARFLSQMGLGTVYNGRVSVKVVSGEGRVYAYGSNVDNNTEDPTYVPAQ